MITYPSKVADQAVAINVVERDEDLEGFREFVRKHLRCLAVDSETTGLDIYSDTFRLRMVQFGTPTEAWVVPVELSPSMAEDVGLALLGLQEMVLHNASFDLQVFDRHLDIPMEDLWPKVTDTRILSHLVDPKARREGGIGHSLEDLTRFYIDESVADDVKGLMNMLRLRHKTTKAKIFSIIDWQDPDYQLYAGMDTILAARLVQKLTPLVPGQSARLIRYEHELAEVCAYMERTGFLLDVEYSEKLSDQMWLAGAAAKTKADELGCENVNSTEMVADALEAMGVVITGRTPSGKRQVNSKLLEGLAAEGNELAAAVIEAKKWNKWEKTWVHNFLEGRDSNDRCHAHINPLQARTGRMSITGIPAQTLPAGDSMIRNCFIADEGHSIVSADYQAQELRVLAALSGDKTMTRAFEQGEDLHLLTARAAFGPQVQKEDRERQYAKTVNFGRVYGGGAATVAEQTGISIEQAKKVVAGFDRAYPGVKELSGRLQKEALAAGHIFTPTGRRLPVDPVRSYAALNYLIQSTSRDVTGAALLRLHADGFTPYLRLPIHDEILASIPAESAETMGMEIAEIMHQELRGVSIQADYEVGGRSWGSLYG